MTDAADAVPAPQRAEGPSFLTDTRFDSFDLPQEVARGLQEAGFVQCTPIQAQVLPVALAGKDIAGQAQTGTGKTAAFLVTVLTRLMEMEDRTPNQPAAIIVAPTRELAAQIYEEALSVGRHTPFSFAQIVGGVDYQKQAELLKAGVDIVICTPGRIIDYFKQGIFKTGEIKIAVIDEADRLLDLGFAKDMRFILRKLPHFEKRQTMLFSATLSYRVMELTYEFMNLPEFIAVTPEEITVDRIEQSLLHVGKERKLTLLLGLLQREEWHRMLIFANTKSGVEWLSQKLRGNGYPAEGITGDLPQKKRFKLMEQFKKNEVKILVATDVASRGIHVEDISHVINYDLPQDAENYVHRIGRTARAGKAGRAISLACEDYVFHLEPLEEMLGYKIPLLWPEEDWYTPDVAGPVKTSARARGGRRQTTRKPREKAREKTRDKAGEKTREKSRATGPPRLLTPTGEPRPEGYFPGSFFGFTPKVKEAPPVAAPDAAASDAGAPDGAEPPVEPSAAEGVDTAESTKKRRRKRRRKKKTAAPAGNDAVETNAPAATGPEEVTKEKPRSPRRRSPRKRSAPSTAESAPGPGSDVVPDAGDTVPDASPVGGEPGTTES